MIGTTNCRQTVWINSEGCLEPNLCACACGAGGTAYSCTTREKVGAGVVERPFPLQRIHKFPLRSRGTTGLRQRHIVPCPLRRTCLPGAARFVRRTGLCFVPNGSTCSELYHRRKA